MSEFSILKANYTSGCTADNIRRGRKLKGSIIQFFTNGVCTRTPNPLANYVLLKTPWMSDAVAEGYCKKWMRELDYVVLNHSVPLDGYRIRAWGVNESNSDHDVNYGRITRTMVENYLNKWNGIVQSAATNEVVFDVGVYEIAISENFWDIALNSSLFTQVYTQATGMHEITFDYTGYDPDVVENRILARNGTIISIADNEAVFSYHRSTVMQMFKAEVQRKVERMLWRNRYRLTESAVDTIIANSGLYTMDETTFNSNLIDLLID